MKKRGPKPRPKSKSKGRSKEYTAAVSSTEATTITQGKQASAGANPANDNVSSLLVSTTRAETTVVTAPVQQSSSPVYSSLATPGYNRGSSNSSSHSPLQSLDSSDPASVHSALLSNKIAIAADDSSATMAQVEATPATQHGPTRHPVNAPFAVSNSALSFAASISTTKAASEPAAATPSPAVDTGTAVKTIVGGENTRQSTPSDVSTMDSVLHIFFSSRVSEEVRLAVIYYFDYLYARIPIFHPATFVRRVVLGQVDSLLIDALRASTARIITQKTGMQLDADKITTSVRERLLKGLDNPTVDYVQAVVLTAAVLGGQSKFFAYNSITCLASSLVTRLGWHTIDLERPSENLSWEEWVELETKRRTFWAVYQLDCYQSLMADRPMTIDASRIYVMTPGSDYTWDDITVPQILHWPTRHQKDIQKSVLIRTAALSYTFIELCNMLVIVTRMNDFLWNVKVNVLRQTRGSAHTTDLKYFEAPPVPDLGAASGSIKSLFEYPGFQKLHQNLLSWRDELVPAEDMKEQVCSPMSDFSQFGCTENRRYAMRIRYFSLRCYSTPMLQLLHFANRPSFFDPQYQKPKNVGGLVASVAVAESDEDKVLRSMLSIAFSEMLNDGFLAYDIVDESWKFCVNETYELLKHLDKNSDIPIERCDASISFCLFTSITVLIRNVRMCRQKIEQLELKRTSATNDPDVAATLQQQETQLRDDLSKSANTLRRMWNMVKDLGFIWELEGMEMLLRTMQVEEIANAVDLFSGLSL
ncbi:hypothetical protein GGI25_005304 [Coemansia spiralis]|uniref:Xylanolytic transcriptional activator regulatory domain-containing protein n=2 Tax=Coemansia TaxID=4863 RepID=A0A9W8G2H2_9FUNG|nr:hypothetical protein GGI25_005304 [Coemansia spiralis]